MVIVYMLGIFCQGNAKRAISF